ncbi:hypothetical protein Bca101_001847 [Brassica carinata]
MYQRLQEDFENVNLSHILRSRNGRADALAKKLVNNNALNNARATLAAVQQMKQFRGAALERGRFPMEELWK